MTDLLVTLAASNPVDHVVNAAPHSGKQGAESGLAR